jgi:beta-phosphoglucomutase-like phosphatase (HAD superfamily)
MYFSDLCIDRFVSCFDVAVFDLNGLLVDDEQLQLQATNDALATFGFGLSEKTWLARCVGHKPSEYLPEMFPWHQNVDVRGVIQQKDAIYAELIKGRAKDVAFAGALSFLQYVNASKKVAALATSTTKSGAFTILGEHGLNVLGRFTFVITGDDVEKAKPDPEIYNKVRSAVGNSLSYIVLEDSATGVASAKAAGMTCLAVPNRFTASQDFTLADLVITSLQRDARLLQQLITKDDLCRRTL